MAMQRQLLSLAVMAAMLIDLSMAATYTVGGTTGWDTSSDPQTWASSKTFLVGDTLSFQYSPMHNVIEVPKSDYDACQTSNLIQVYNDGSTTIPLTSPGKRYFICGTAGHCQSGMKLEITTLATASSPPEAAPPTSAPKSSSPSSSPRSSSTRSPPLSSDSPLANSPSSSLSPIAPSTESHGPAPPPSAATVNYEGSFRAGLVGFGALVMLLAF
ncbi:Phytocyanin domain containing protein [Parasponia andersonii]|uniref:Phytocyanin domain containing protein n=1 Tax=Parasponia andersonii TaxID=3476 RepID=A0A2P5BIB2_PARAD|nr:Phytocyanin domain containing protein [Parasponia andersonii]